MWSAGNPRSASTFSTSRYDRKKRKYHPTASRMSSGSNCRHLNKPQTEDARRSILPAYHRMTAKLQHFQIGYLFGRKMHAAGLPLHQLSEQNCDRPTVRPITGLKIFASPNAH